ncbi:MAG: ROK family protein [Cyanobacteriota bacterium]
MIKENIIGIDIGGTKISYGLLKLDGNLIDTITLPALADKPKEIFINQLITGINNLLTNNNIDINIIKGIGICCPGPINPITGDIINPPNLPMLWNTNLIQLIKRYYKVPIKVENDANAAALAEILIGAAKNLNNILYVTVSTGIGTGIIIDRKIYHGKNGLAGEGGHISINYHDKIKCNCNAPGCIESIASGTGIASKAKELIITNQVQNSLLKSFSDNPDQISAKQIAEFAKQNDSLSIALIEESAFNIGAWLGGMINLLDPDMIVIGGGVSFTGELFFNKVRATALKFTYNIFASETPIMPAKLKTNAGIYGAASLFLNDIN